MTNVINNHMSHFTQMASLLVSRGSWLYFWLSSFIIICHNSLGSFPSSAQRCCGLELKWLLSRYWICFPFFQIKWSWGNWSVWTWILRITPLDLYSYASGKLRKNAYCNTWCWDLTITQWLIMCVNDHLRGLCDNEL